jgi:chromosome partitioning protein
VWTSEVADFTRWRRAALIFRGRAGRQHSSPSHSSTAKREEKARSDRASDICNLRSRNRGLSYQSAVSPAPRIALIARQGQQLMRAHVIAVANPKGGVGTTTLAINLACALAGPEAPVALVDNDEQGSAAAWARAGKLPVHCLHLPLGRTEEVESWADVVRRMRERHDIVIIDLPAAAAPALSVILLVSSLVLIPVAPCGLELNATRRLLRQINRARRKRGDAGPGVLVVPSRVADICESTEAVRARLALLGQELAPPLALRPEYEAAFARGHWVGTACPGSSAHEEIGAVARLVRERLSQLSPVLWPTEDAAAAVGSFQARQRSCPASQVLVDKPTETSPIIAPRQAIAYAAGATVVLPFQREAGVPNAGTAIPIELQDGVAEHPAAETADTTACESAAEALVVVPPPRPGRWHVPGAVAVASAGGIWAALGLAAGLALNALLAEAPVPEGPHGTTPAAAASPSTPTIQVPIGATPALAASTTFGPTISNAIESLRVVREQIERLAPTVVRLRAERDGLRSQLLQAQGELAEAQRRLAALEPAGEAPSTSGPPPPRRIRVMIRYSIGVLDGRDEALAHRLAEELTRVGFEVAGVLPVQRRIRRGAIHYFSEQDAPQVGRIAEVGSLVLTQAGGSAGLGPIELINEEPRPIPGNVEVLLPSVKCESFCGTGQVSEIR